MLELGRALSHLGGFSSRFSHVTAFLVVVARATTGASAHVHNLEHYSCLCIARTAVFASAENHLACCAGYPTGARPMKAPSSYSLLCAGELATNLAA